MALTYSISMISRGNILCHRQRIFRTVSRNISAMARRAVSSLEINAVSTLIFLFVLVLVFIYYLLSNCKQVKRRECYENIYQFNCGIISRNYTS